MVNLAPLLNLDVACDMGDPISPYLFALCMEYFSYQLSALKNDADFSFHPRCKKLNITHLLFADDLLLFCGGDRLSVEKLHTVFENFSECSGLSANVNKSCIYLAGVPEIVAEDIKALTGMKEGTFPFRYLGIPLHAHCLSPMDCKSLVDQITSSVRHWSTRFLSYAGRIELIR